MIPNPWEMLITAIGFFTLLFVVINKITPMYNRIYKNRVSAIEGGLARAEKAQIEANKALIQYKDKLKKAEEEANLICEEARKQGIYILSEMKKKANVEATRISEITKEKLEADRRLIISSMRKEIGSLAIDLAEKIVGESLKDDDRSRRTIDRFIEDINESYKESNKARTDML